jgi:hypothetical protein
LREEIEEKMNNQNLKPFTKENAKEFGSKGGKASAKSKAELSTIKKQLNYLLDLPVRDRIDIDKLKASGFQEEEINNKLLMTYSLFEKAINGDIKAFNTIKGIIEKSDSENFNFDLFD